MKKILYLFVMSFFLFTVSTSGFGAVLFDNSNHTNGDAGLTNLVFTHNNIAGTQLFVYVGYIDTTDTVLNITYKNLSLTLINSSGNMGGTNQLSEMWVLNSPPTGNHQINVTFTGATVTAYAGSTSFTGTETTYTGRSSFNGTLGTMITHLQTSKANSVILDGVQSGNTNIGTAGTNQSQLWVVNDGTGSQDAAQSYRNTTGIAFYPMSWTGGQVWTKISVEVKEAAQTNFTITAYDEYNNRSLSNFTANVSGTVYSTTSGLITTALIIENGNLANISLSSSDTGGYFNKTYWNYNTSTALNASLIQTQSFMVATLKITNQTITGAFQATNQSGTVLNLSAGTYTINFTNTTAYPTLYSKTVQLNATNNVTITIENVTQVYVNVTVKDGQNGSTINTFNATLNYVGAAIYTQHLNTVTGNATFPDLIWGTYSINVTAAGYGTPGSISHTTNFTGNLSNVTIYMYQNFSITAKDEYNGRSISNFTAILISGSITSQQISNRQYNISNVTCGSISGCNESSDGDFSTTATPSSGVTMGYVNQTIAIPNQTTFSSVIVTFNGYNRYSDPLNTPAPNMTIYYYNYTASDYYELGQANGTNVSVFLPSDGYSGQNYIHFKFNITAFSGTPPVCAGGCVQGRFYDTIIIANGTEGVINSSISESYFTTNGIITTNYTRNQTSVFNITILSNDSGGYFQKNYYNRQVSSNLIANLTQVEARFILLEKGTSAAVASNFSTTNSTGTVLNLSAATHRVTAFNSLYFNISSDFTYGALSNDTRTITGAYNHLLNITAWGRTTNTSITTFNVTVVWLNYSNYTEQYSTTNGTIYGKLLNGSYFIALESNEGVGYAIANATLNLTGILNSTKHNFTLYTTNSINFTFRDETTYNLISSQTVTVQFISEFASYNYTTSTGYLYVDLLSPTNYTIRYSAPTYQERFYFFTISNQTTSSITLYLLNMSASGRENVTIFVIDENTFPVEGALVKVLKYNQSTNSYITTQIITTNYAGSAQADMTLGNEYYKFVVEYPAGTTKLVTTASYYYSSPITLQILLSPQSGEIFRDIQNIQYSPTFNLSTSRFVWSYNDPLNQISRACVEVYGVSLGTQTLVNSSCSTSTSGTIALYVDNSSGNYYVSNFIVYYDTTGVFIDSFTKFFTSAADFGKFGLFLTLIIFMTIVLIVRNPVICLMISPMAFVFGNIIGLIQFDWSTILAVYGIFIIAGFIISKVA